MRFETTNFLHAYCYRALSTKVLFFLLYLRTHLYFVARKRIQDVYLIIVMIGVQLRAIEPQSTQERE